MPALLDQSNAAVDQSLAIPGQVLEGLASRFRAGGLFLLAGKPDGTIAWHDQAAGMFFLRFVLPVLQSPQLLAADPNGRTARADAAASVYRPAPGVIVATIPHTQNRLLIGKLLLAARDESFLMTEDVQRLCGRLALDAAWLEQQARELPGYADTVLSRQARLLLACLRDQLRLASLEHELSTLSEQLACTYEELSLIYQVSSGMKINRGAADFFRQTCLDVLQTMGIGGVGVALHPDFARAHPHVLYGRMSVPADVVQALGDELIPLMQNQAAPLLINDLAAQERLGGIRTHARRLLAVPLQRYEKTFGCLFALDTETGEFDSADAKLFTSIANESAVYLENATLFEDVHSLMMGLLHSLTSAVDAKDTYTCGHSERVALLSRHLAQKMGLSDHEVEQVYMAGLLHDVGKIGVPESVLQKTGKLTVEEFDQMKKHPRIGARILADVPQVKGLIPGVLYHHERYDGKGYPAGLAAQDIPLMGRIICLADSFDAMTSNRTYRSALPPEVALIEIRRCAGTHFDPELAETFLRTPADGYRELLSDHQEKSKRLLDLTDVPHTAAH